MSSGANSTKGYENVVRLTRAVLLLSVVAALFGSATVIAQQLDSNTRQPASKAEENVSSAPTEEPANREEDAEDARPAGSIAPQVIAKTYTATAYSINGRTATGIPVRRGIIAADPKVLPLGSVVRLHAGKYSGIYSVMDTGGDIRGQRIDIYFPSRAEAIKFGRRKVGIEVIRRGWAPDTDVATRR